MKPAVIRGVKSQGMLLAGLKDGKAVISFFEGDIAPGSKVQYDVPWACFGGRINFHPHLHFLVTEGGVDEAGVFHKVGSLNDDRLTEEELRRIPSKGWAALIRKPH